MKKALTGILVLCLLLSLCACTGTGGKSTGETSSGAGFTISGSRDAETAATSAEIVSEAQTTAAQTAEALTTLPTAPTQTAPDGDIIIDCGYYTIRLPASWEGKYLATPGDEDQPGTIRLREIESHNNHFGGSLFLLTLYPSDKDYSDYPCSLIASLEIDGLGTYNLVHFYPTDAQYDPNNAETYLAMYDDVPAILASIEFKDGVTVLSG